MVLEGLRFPSWLGWLTGIYFVKRPWGTPEFTGWFHIYCVYSACVNATMQALWFEFQLKTTDVVNSSSLTVQLLAKAMIIGNSLFDFYFRVSFGILKGRVPKFLEILEHPDLKLTQRCLMCWRLQRVYMWVIMIPRFLSMIVFTMWYKQMLPPDEQFVISSPWYFIVFFVCGAIPAASSVIFAYDFVLVTTFYMVRIFEDFCETIEGHILKINESSISPSGSIIALAETGGDDKEEFRKRRSSIYIANPREVFIDKFDKVKEMFSMYDHIVGALLLGLVLRTGFIITHSVNSLMLNVHSDNLKFGFDVLSLLTELPQLLILKVGDTAHGKIAFAKEHLHNMAILLPQSSQRDEVMEIIHFIAQWKWKMTACNFFTISSKLMAGIVTTTMSYVVILFQLHLSEIQTSSNSNCSFAE